DASFDVVILFEAIYYLKHPKRFLIEARRVLRPGGRLLISTVHPQWRGFNPSPFSVHYPTAGELYDLVHAEGFTTHLYAAFPAKPIGSAGRLISWVRRLAVAGRLIPRTMRGKELLKRLFYGQLSPVPRIVHDGMAPCADMVTLSSDANAREYKFLYVLAEAPRRRAA
ncbi:MAG: class I SAM-dependent methyltransferase, partial [Planctomycetaceae bacterium]